MTHSKQVFITGVSSGLGLGLAQAYTNDGCTVYGVSRRPCEELMGHEQFHHCQLDVSDFAMITQKLPVLFENIDQLDLVILNAGVLGKIQDLRDTPLTEIKKIMDVNLWANKIIIGTMIDCAIEFKQVVAISSGAAVSGNRGWGGYSISKAALNMLMKLYASELPLTHFTSLAPGLIDTAMQDYLCEKVNVQKFETVQKLVDARHTQAMPTPDVAGLKIKKAIENLSRFESGAFIDVRNIE